MMRGLLVRDFSGKARITSRLRGSASPFEMGNGSQTPSLQPTFSGMQQTYLR